SNLKGLMIAVTNFMAGPFLIGMTSHRTTRANPKNPSFGRQKGFLCPEIGHAYGAHGLDSWRRTKSVLSVDL
ncbi:MAG: hypothetical protein ACO3GJ_00765, partial [Burkholderiaceae bacterium]